MVEKTGTLLDIGSDHAYVPIRLLQENTIDRAAVSDVNIGPVRTARKNVERYSLSDRVDFFVSDGLRNNYIEVIDLALICGMGGELIADIISNDMLKARMPEYLVLQPMNSRSSLRRFLYDNDFTIVKEDIVKEKGHFYTVMKVIAEKDRRQFDDIFFDIGYCPYEQGHEFFTDYLNHIIDKNLTIIRNCEGRTSEKAVKASENAKRYIQLITGVKESYESKRFNQVHQ